MLETPEHVLNHSETFGNSLLYAGHNCCMRSRWLVRLWRKVVRLVDLQLPKPLTQPWVLHHAARPQPLQACGFGQYLPQAEPRVLKLHKASSFAIQSRQSVQRDIALRFNRVDWALLRTLEQLKTRLLGAWQQATQPSHNVDKNPVTGGPERKLNV
jgi:hypothetical protein